MPHAFPFWGIVPGNIDHHWLIHPPVNKQCRILLLDTTHLTYYHHYISHRVFFKQFQDVRHVGKHHRVSPNTHHRTLTKSSNSQVDTDLVGKGTTSGDYADTTGSEHVPRQDTHLGFTGSDNSGTGGANKPRTSFIGIFPDFHDIVDRYMLSNDDNDTNTRIDSFDG
ncbi:hypothetical protein ES703_43642 [subsurface metagenome]